MYTFEELICLFEQELTGLELTKEPKLLYEPIHYLLEAGGKRVRPIMALMATNMLSDNISDTINASIAIELFHNFTLLHDDIMDNASIRRGRATVNCKWDDNIAIISGDAMSIMAYGYMAKSPASVLPRVLSVFNKFCIEICEGQRYDMDYQLVSEISKEQYIEMIRLKTAVLLAGSMEIGAVIGGADEDTIQKLYKFGECLGLAFQLTDDMLDTYGDSKTFGKEIGGDITEGKKTFLYISTLLNAPTSQHKDIIELFHSQNLSKSEKIDAVKCCYDKYQARELLEQEIEMYYQKAKEALDSIALPIEKKQVAYKFAELLIYRIK